MKKNIVILYSKNHCDQSALAIKEYLNTKQDLVNVILVDESKYSNLFSNQIGEFIYKFTMRNIPWLNKLNGFFTNTYFTKLKKKKNIVVQENNNSIEDKQESFKGLKARFRQVDNIIDRFDPDVVLCTTTKSLGKALWSKDRLDAKACICAVMTDYCTNQGFANDAADKFLVQNNSIKQTLVTIGIPEEKIEILGTPILKKTKKVYDRKEVEKELGILNQQIPNVIIVGGRYGAGKMKNAFKDLATYTEKMNIIILANGSENIHTFVQSYCKSAKLTENIYCIDSISDIAKLYSIADVMVTTPTANITYEASSRKIPCVLIKPSNFIENGNFSYLTSNGFVMRGEKTTHIVPSVLSIINKDQDYKEVINNLSNEFSQDCAKSYGEYLLKLNPVKTIEDKTIATNEIVEKKKEEKPKKQKKEKKTK